MLPAVNASLLLLCLAKFILLFSLPKHLPYKSRLSLLCETIPLLLSLPFSAQSFECFYIVDGCV